MEKSKVKRAIYLRIFAGFLAVYLVLMAGFSLYLFGQTSKVESLELYTRGIMVNNTIEKTLQNHLDGENRIDDIAKFRRELAFTGHLFTYGGRELAVYSGDYQSLYHTNDYWICEFTEFAEGNRRYMGRAYLNPGKWFSEEETAELEGYLSAVPEPQQVGEVSGYLVSLDGFWLDQEMVIPHRVVVTPMYAEKFDEEGRVTLSSGREEEKTVYVANSKNTAGLPYFERGSIHPLYLNEVHLDKERKGLLRTVVLDQEKLKRHIEQKQVGEVLSERVDLLTYRYYLVLPSQNIIKVRQDNSYYSDFWTIIAGEVNLWEKCRGTLAVVGLSCLLIFLVVALILAMQTYRTYEKKEELERRRRELTNALAHDLKTPLSIISGYAQNLLENIQTEKRRQYATGILEKVEHMDRITREMLDLSKLETVPLSMHCREVSLAAICREVIARYADVCSERSLKTELEGEQIVKADPALIKRVIDNFFVNALAHTPEHGIIKISISQDTLRFYNSGSRIPPERIKDIWYPFEKADSSRGNTKGTGLGLAIAARILAAHHYAYGAKNCEDGVVFWFKFA